MRTHDMTTHTLNMKKRVPIITTRLMIAGLLAVATFVGVEQKILAIEPPTDPAYTAHSAHVAAASQAGGQTFDAQLAEMRARIQQMEAIIQQQPGQSPVVVAMPMGAGNLPRIRPMPGIGSSAKPMQGKMADMNMTGGRKGGMGGGRAVADQLAELRAKMQRLDAAMQQQSGSMSGAMPMSGMPGMGSGTKPMQGKMAGMSDMGEGNPPSGGAPVAMKPTDGMGGMGGDASPPGGEMGMMMNKMMVMMDKMMGGMGGGTMPAGAPRGEAAAQGGGAESMNMGTMNMGKTSKMGKPDKTGKTGKTGKMDTMSKMGKTSKMSKMNKMEMMGGMGDSSMAMPSALPGIPGTSHLYHIGATGFFLDHPQHIALGTEQQMMLNQIKEQATLDKANADRCVQEAEQDLWMLTAADQPNYVQIEAKIAQIEKLRGDARLRFIGAIGRAAIILNDKQRKILTGFALSVSAPPAEVPKAGRMKGM